MAATDPPPVGPVSEPFYPSPHAWFVGVRAVITGATTGARLIIERAAPVVGLNWSETIETVSLEPGTPFERTDISPKGGLPLRARIEPTDPALTAAGAVTVEFWFTPVP